MEGLFLFAGLFSVLLVLIPTGLLLGLLVVFALRAEPDEADGRASALYLAMATFVALFTALAAVVTLSTSVVDLVAGDDAVEGGWSAFPTQDDEGFPMDESFEGGGRVSGSVDFFGGGDQLGGRDADDRAIDGIVASLIVLLVSGAVLWFHQPRLERVGAAHLAGTAAWRMRRAYRLTACFFSVLIVLVSASLALYGVWSVAAPGVSGAGAATDHTP